MSPARSATAISLALASMGMCLAQPALKGNDDERQRLYRWIDTFDHGTVAKGPFIEIPLVTASKFGFLRSETKTELQLTRTDGASERIRFRLEKGPPYRHVDFRKWMTDWTDFYDKAHLYLSGCSTESLVAAVLLSRACESRGLKDEAARLFTSARQAATSPQHVFEHEQNVTTHIFVDEYCSLQLDDILGDLFDPAVSRSNVLYSLKVFVKHVPHFKTAGTNVMESAGLPAAKAAIEVLEAMTSEEKSRGHGPVQDKTAELIYQLRDSTTLVSYFGFNFLDPTYAGNEPAENLLAIGLPAVPQLMEAMRARRFTRASFEASMPIHFQTPVYVRDQALNILSIMANRDLTVTTSKPGDSRIDWDKTIESAKTWYAGLSQSQVHKGTRSIPFEN